MDMGQLSGFKNICRIFQIPLTPCYTPDIPLIKRISASYFLDRSALVFLPVAAVGSRSFLAAVFFAPVAIPVTFFTIPLLALAAFVTIVVPLLDSDAWLPSLERGCRGSGAAGTPRFPRTVPAFAA